MSDTEKPQPDDKPELDDKPEPDWVIKGIKGTLARAGLSFEDDKTLRKILESGTIAVAIVEFADDGGGSEPSRVDSSRRGSSDDVAQAIPEPSAGAVVLLLFGHAFLARRRRRRAAQARLEGGALPTPWRSPRFP